MARNAGTILPERATVAERSRLPGETTLLVALGLIAVTVLAYLPAIGWGGFVWDDDFHVTDSAVLRDGDGLRRIWFEPRSIPQYYPLVHTTFWIEHQLWGLQPLGYHLVNVLLHGLNAVLLWRILLRLKLPRGAPLLAALIFALHPVHVESVAWITERKNVLSGMFYLAALLAYLRFEGIGAAVDPKATSKAVPGRAWFAYALSLGLFIAALLSKTVTCSLPAVLLLVLWWQRPRLSWRELAPLAPMLLIGLAAGLGTIVLEKQHVGAQGEAYDLSMLERCLIAGNALWFYAGKILWPLDLAFSYERWRIDVHDPMWSIAPIAAVALLIGLWLARHRLGKGPVVAVAAFAGTLLPALGFIDVFPMRYTFVADHYQYLASIGLIALFAAAWMGLFGAKTISGPARARPIMACIILPAVVLAALAVLAWRQSWIYQDQETLWRDTAAQSPRGWLPFHRLALALEQQGKVEPAIAAYRQAIANDPSYGDTYINLGTLLVAQGDFDGAQIEIRKGLQLLPRHVIGHNVLGGILELQGRIEEAIGHYRLALDHQPQFTPARLNLAHALLRRGRGAEALSELNAALEHEPDMSGALRLRVANGFRVAGAIPEATEQFARVAAAEPDNLLAVQMWGLSLATLGRHAEAIPVLERSLRLAPDDPATINALLRLYEMTDRADAAAALRQRVSPLQP